MCSLSLCLSLVFSLSSPQPKRHRTVMASRIPRRGVSSSSSGLRKPAGFDPTAYAKKMAEKKAKAERIRQERRAKAAQNAAAAAEREKARR